MTSVQKHLVEHASWKSPVEMELGVGLRGRLRDFVVHNSKGQE